MHSNTNNLIFNFLLSIAGNIGEECNSWNVGSLYIYLFLAQKVALRDRVLN